METIGRLLEDFGPGDSWGKYLTWADGRKEAVGNNGAFTSGMMAGERVNFKSFGHWSPEAKTILEAVAKEKAAFAPLSASIYEADYRDRAFTGATVWVLLHCGVEIQMRRREAEARKTLGEVTMVE